MRCPRSTSSGVVRREHDMRGWLAGCWDLASSIFRNAPVPVKWKQELRYALLKLDVVSNAIARRSHPGSLEPGSASPPAQGGLPDIFIWSIIDWHYRTQRPHHLAKGFARRGHRVFFVSGHFVDNRASGFRVEPIDGTGALFVVYIHATSPSIYLGLPDQGVRGQMTAAVRELVGWAQPGPVVSIVQHPFWLEFAEQLPRAMLVYDLMDLHEGFEVNAADILREESRLLEAADLVVVTSRLLEHLAKRTNRNVVILRNAGEYPLFASPPAETFQDARGRRIVGYFGAISHWFDLDLVERLAREQTETLIVLLGADAIGARERLEPYGNVLMPGEVEYGRLPFYLHAFDVCIVPFKITPLTLATNPVKVYEYLSAGRPVVSVDLPEIAEFGDLVMIAVTHDEFLSSVRRALNAPSDPASEAARRRFASEHTWDRLTALFWEAVVHSEPAPRRQQPIP